MAKGNGNVLIYVYVRLSASSLGVCCCLTEIIAINLDTSSDNSSLDSNNTTSDSASTSQISTSQEIDYDSPEYKGPPKNISKAKACMLAKSQASDASSKAKVQACGSKVKLQTSGLKTFRVKIPPTMACAEQKKEKRKISRGSRFYLFMNFEIIVLSSNSSYDKKGPSKASVPIFEGPSVQGLLDYYGYNDIEEYL
ncbi:hypothetical protein Tco_0989622 [Tanacetum coccineum]|uniref:Uncharacterized protein n=1 Tax=Tanacetum coccineum TaxID=301880 RepID=A0ABQ5EU65_9ASTR